MFKFCSHSETLKTNYIEYVWKIIGDQCVIIFYLFLIPRTMYFVFNKKSYVRQVKSSWQPYVYYICKQYAIARTCGARNYQTIFGPLMAKGRVNSSREESEVNTAKRTLEKYGVKFS